MSLGFGATNGNRAPPSVDFNQLVRLWMIVRFEWGRAD